MHNIYIYIYIYLPKEQHSTSNGKYAASRALLPPVKASQMPETEGMNNLLDNVMLVVGFGGCEFLKE